MGRTCGKITTKPGQGGRILRQVHIASSHFKQTHRIG
jgi:hypothetical protein